MATTTATNNAKTDTTKATKPVENVDALVEKVVLDVPFLDIDEDDCEMLSDMLSAIIDAKEENIDDAKRDKVGRRAALKAMKALLRKLESHRLALVKFAELDDDN